VLGLGDGRGTCVCGEEKKGLTNSKWNISYDTGVAWGAGCDLGGDDGLKIFVCFDI
jgi:hypothetical protein